jgi:uncharacterized RDD family membrane protein YckC
MVIIIRFTTRRAYMPNDQPNHPPAANPYAPPQTIPTVPDAGEHQLASRGKRLGGVFIDGIIVTLCTLPVLLLVFGGWTNYVTRVGEGGFLIQLGVTIFGVIVYLLINGYLLAKNGQTIGKKLLSTKIVRTDGSAVDLQRIILRRYLPLSIAYIIPVVGYLIGLINALLIFRESHQCGHDNLADTIVVEAKSV